MTDARERLDQVDARTNAATEGPWAPWLDQDGAEHMRGLLMVGNADGVIPDGEAISLDGLDANPIAHAYTDEDRAFIANARTDLPAATTALRAVLDLVDEWEDALNEDREDLPSSTVRLLDRLYAELRTAITTALEDA